MNLLSNGYPSKLNDDQIVGKLLMRDVKLKYPNYGNSEFVLLYDGEGVIHIGFDATIV